MHENPSTSSIQRFVQCSICSMYVLMTFEEYLKVCGEITDENNVTKCTSCVHKDSLLSQIVELSNKVLYLETRLTAARQINELEKDLDKSINNLSNKMAATSLADEHHTKNIMRALWFLIAPRP